jgi:hypothetical protein
LFIATALVCSAFVEPQQCHEFPAQVPPFESEELCESFARTFYLALTAPLFEQYVLDKIGNPDLYTVETRCTLEGTLL